MELKIDLANREEVAAAASLLAVILQGTQPGADRHEVREAVQQMQAPAAVPTLTDVVQPPAPPEADAATVFGGHPATVPAGAAPFVLPTAVPSTAAATPSPTAPAALPAGVPALPPVPSVSAPPTVPVAPVQTDGATVANLAGGVVLDAAGLPWDERIHAGTKRQNADGTWTAKRGLNDPAFVQRVVAELRARAGAGPAPAAAAAPAAPAVPFVPPVVPSPPAPPVAPSEPAGPPTSFEQFMLRVTVAVANGVIPGDAAKTAVEDYKLPSVSSLQSNTQYIPHVWMRMQQYHPALV